MNATRMVYAAAAVVVCAGPVPPYAFAGHDRSPGEFAARTLAPRRVNASQIAAFNRPVRSTPRALV